MVRKIHFQTFFSSGNIDISTGEVINVVRQTVCLVVNPVNNFVNNFAALFNGTPLHAGGSGLRRNDGSCLKLSVKLVGA